MLKKTIKIGQLFDFYGQLLTQKQFEIVSDYYLNNYSLGEISEKYNISRQAVYDHLQRAENSLVALDSKLNLVAKDDIIRTGLANLKNIIETAPMASPREKTRIFQAIEDLVERYGGI